MTPPDRHQRFFKFLKAHRPGAIFSGGRIDGPKEEARFGALELDRHYRVNVRVLIHEHAQGVNMFKAKRGVIVEGDDELGSIVHLRTHHPFHALTPPCALDLFKRNLERDERL